MVILSKYDMTSHRPRPTLSVARNNQEDAMDVSPGSMSATYPGWHPAGASRGLPHWERACRGRTHLDPDWSDAALSMLPSEWLADCWMAVQGHGVVARGDILNSHLRHFNALIYNFLIQHVRTWKGR